MRLFRGVVTSFRARVAAALLSDVTLSKMYASGERVTWADMRRVWREARQSAATADGRSARR